MRGSDERTGSLFSYVDVEDRVRADHPLRTIRRLANAALADLSRDFEALYTKGIPRKRHGSFTTRRELIEVGRCRV